MKIYKNHNLISFKGKAMAYNLIKKKIAKKKTIGSLDRDP